MKFLIIGFALTRALASHAQFVDVVIDVNGTIADVMRPDLIRTADYGESYRAPFFSAWDHYFVAPHVTDLFDYLRTIPNLRVHFYGLAPAWKLKWFSRRLRYSDGTRIQIASVLRGSWPPDLSRYNSNVGNIVFLSGRTGRLSDGQKGTLIPLKVEVDSRITFAIGALDYALQQRATRGGNIGPYVTEIIGPLRTADYPLRPESDEATRTYFLQVLGLRAIDRMPQSAKTACRDLT